MTMKGANFLEKLLDNQPVEWKKLGEVCDIKTGKGVTKKDAVEDGVYPIISGGKTPMDYIDKYNRDANTVTVSRVGANAGYVNYLGEKFYLNDKCFSVIPKIDYIDSKFLYYILKAREQQITAMQSLGGVPTINTSKVGSIKIPLPPLSVQSRIVEILDKFTSLEAELEEQLQAELELRKKQYAYYREQLLNFSYTPPSEFNVVYRKLGEVAQYSKGRIDASTLSAKNYVGVDNLLQNCQGKKLSEHVPTEGRCTAYSPKDILIGNIRPYLKKIWFADNAGGTNGDVLVIQTTDERVLPKYLYQVLSDDAFFTYDMQHAKGAKMPRGNKDKILDYKIPLPPLSEQQRIVEILDKFDTLTNSISEGLPLEIQLRRQQYEYYREQLLAFPHP